MSILNILLLVFGIFIVLIGFVIKYKINIERIYYKIKSIMDSFRYKSLEDKDAPTNFNLIDFINNNTGTHLIAFPGAGWLFDNFIETCVTCGTWIPF